MGYDITFGEWAFFMLAMIFFVSVIGALCSAVTKIVRICRQRRLRRPCQCNQCIETRQRFGSEVDYW